MEDLREPEKILAPLAESLTVVLVGLRNAGKSSLLNALFERPVAIVSPEAGTTTDPVTRKMELKGWGALAFVDTAGLDDVGDLGKARVERSIERLKTASLAIFVSPGHKPPEPAEKELLEALKKEKIPYLVVLTYADLPLNKEKDVFFTEAQRFYIDLLKEKTLPSLRKALIDLAPSLEREKTPLSGLVNAGDHILFVMPQDASAPRGRLILPQAETLRDALDRHLLITAVQTEDLPLIEGKGPFDLVICDSRSFAACRDAFPASQALTSFSILFARKKGELSALVKGLSALEEFKSGGRIFIFEACAHHREKDDIASVEIPRLFREKTGKDAEFFTVRSIPEDISSKDIVIHCAACMMSSKAFVARMDEFRRRGIIATNFGVFLSWAHGLFPRAILPLPEYKDDF